MIQDDGVSVPDRATAAEPEVSALRDGIANALSDADTIALLRSDLRKLAAGDEVATGCEGCGAMLLWSDDYCSDFHGSGCWWLMTGGKWGQSPCYAYRVASQTPAGQTEEITPKAAELLSLGRAGSQKEITSNPVVRKFRTTAKAIEARSGETGTGSTEGESAVAESDLPEGTQA